jgi:hypothetical protein
VQAAAFGATTIAQILPGYKIWTGPVKDLEKQKTALRPKQAKAHFFIIVKNKKVQKMAAAKTNAKRPACVQIGA